MRLIVRHTQPIELTLAQGSLSVGSAREDGVCIADAGLQPAHAVFSWDFDGRLLVIKLASGARAYVNGRPVTEMAILRAGDSVMLQQLRIDLCADQANLLDLQTALVARSHVPAGAKIVLRCVAGPLFGQSLSLREPLSLLGGARVHVGPCDITSAVMLYWLADHALVLAGADASDIELNGYQGRAGSLHPGDQLRMADSRFVLEAPGVVSRRAGQHDAVTPVYGQRVLELPTASASISQTEGSRTAKRGLLVTLAMAGLIAVILLALLLFVPH